MHLTSLEKTTFVSEEGLYYYKVMTFSLKNIGVTYPKMMDRVFKDKKKKKKNMEVYVDNLLVKSHLDRILLT